MRGGVLTMWDVDKSEEDEWAWTEFGDDDNHGMFERPRRRLDTFVNFVKFSMRYVSLTEDTTDLPEDFRKYINDVLGLENLAADMMAVGLQVNSAGPLFSPSGPDSTSAPTAKPTSLPSLLPSPPPSLLPSDAPSFRPSELPSAPPTVATEMPSGAPSGAPSTAAKPSPKSPTPPGGDDGGSTSTTTIAAASAVAGGALVLVMALIFYRKRRKRKELELQAAAAGGGNRNVAKGGKGGDGGFDNDEVVSRGWKTSKGGKDGEPPPEGAAAVAAMGVSIGAGQFPENGEADDLGRVVVDVDAALEKGAGGGAGVAAGAVAMYGADKDGKGDSGMGMLPHDDSLVSNQSLISAGYSMSSDSFNEADATHHLADEFDQYKDQNLEKMRAEVEGNLTNFDGMMSQALTKALMDDDDMPPDKNELTWGARSGEVIEIEASVLCEMNDWLKRKQGASVDERRAFIQETLNKMVASVRHGFIAPEQASRTIHGCAAMLSLQLAEDIPETALIVTGLRKKAERKHLIAAFKEFGEIEDAAVSPNERGFGLVRFTSPKWVQRAMDRFRTGEIVVQDVAVMCKVLKSQAQAQPAARSHQREMTLPSEAKTSQQYPPPGGRGAAPPAVGPRQTSADSLGVIGYLPGDPLTRQESRSRQRGYSNQPRPPGSDAGSHTSGRSRSSNGHRRQSSGESHGSGRRGKGRSRSTSKEPRPGVFL